MRHNSKHFVLFNKIGLYYSLSWISRQFPPMMNIAIILTVSPGRVIDDKFVCLAEFICS